MHVDDRCHLPDCQRLSGSAFREIVTAPIESLVVDVAQPMSDGQAP